MTDPFDQLLNALENERRYVAKELHDSVAQTILQLGLQAGICRKLLERSNLDLLTNELAQLEERLQLASSQAREIIQDMRPPIVDSDAGLDDYIKYAIDTHAQRGGPPITYHFNPSDDHPLPLSAAQVLTLTRIIQEALLNIRKHAQAHQVRLSVSIEVDNLYMTIADDGHGFDPAEVEARPIDKGGAGLTNLYMRAKAIGATLTVARDTTGQGTKITLILSK